MADSKNTPKGEEREATEPVVPVNRPDHDTALERSVDFDDDHLPGDTAPLERADLDALRALVEIEAEDAAARAIDLAALDDDDDDDIPDDTLNDTVATEALPDEDG